MSSRLQCTSRIWPPGASRERRPSSRRHGWKQARSTPSGTWTTFAAPSRRNSAAAQAVVATTTSYEAAVPRLSLSVSRAAGTPGGLNIVISPARLSCDTIMDRIPRARAQAPVHRSVVRSDHLQPVGLQLVEQPPQRPAGDDGPVTAGARHAPSADGHHQALLGAAPPRPRPGHDEYRLVPGRLVARAELVQRGAQPARGRGHVVGEPHDPHAPILTSPGSVICNSA